MQGVGVYSVGLQHQAVQANQDPAQSDRHTGDGDIDTCNHSNAQKFKHTTVLHIKHLLKHLNIQTF